MQRILNSFSTIVFLYFPTSASSAAADVEAEIWGSHQKSTAFLHATQFFLQKIGKGLQEKEAQCVETCSSIHSTLLVVDHQWEPESLVDSKVDYVSTLWAVTGGCHGTNKSLRKNNYTYNIQQNATKDFQCASAHPETCSDFTVAFQNVSKYCSCSCAEHYLRGSMHMGAHGGLDAMPLDSPHLPETCRILNDIMACLKKPQNFCACNGFRKRKVQQATKTVNGTFKIIEREVWEPDGEVKDEMNTPPFPKPPEAFIEACTTAGHPLLWIGKKDQQKIDCASLNADPTNPIQPQIEEPVVFHVVPKYIEPPLVLI